VDAHPLFDDIGVLLEETDITTADVADLLTPKRANDDGDGGVDSCLTGLVEALRKKAKTGGASRSGGGVQGKEEI
jgi:chaperone BCS1